MEESREMLWRIFETSWTSRIVEIYENWVVKKDIDRLELNQANIDLRRREIEKLKEEIVLLEGFMDDETFLPESQVDFWESVIGKKNEIIDHELYLKALLKSRKEIEAEVSNKFDTPSLREAVISLIIRQHDKIRGVIPHFSKDYDINKISDGCYSVMYNDLPIIYNKNDPEKARVRFVNKDAFKLVQEKLVSDKEILDLIWSHTLRSEKNFVVFDGNHIKLVDYPTNSEEIWEALLSAKWNVYEALSYISDEERNKIIRVFSKIKGILINNYSNLIQEDKNEQ